MLLVLIDVRGFRTGNVLADSTGVHSVIFAEGLPTSKEKAVVLRLVYLFASVVKGNSHGRSATCSDRAGSEKG